MAPQRLPSLQLLPAFEAAARLLSFSKAAQELHLTTSAISQQIKLLESQLGLPLFRRLTRRVELTEAGRHFADVALQTMTAYRQGHADFVHCFAQPTLRLSMTPLIAHEFVLPRVAGFQASHPEVSLSIESSMALIDFDTEPIDAAIRVGSGHWPGLTGWPLCACDATLLAAPDVLAQHPVQHLSDLRDHTLIRRRQEQFGWQDLATLLQHAEVPCRRDLLVDSDLAAVHAAKRGLGIALCILPAAMPTSALWPDNSLIPVLPPIQTPLKAWFVFRSEGAKVDLLKDVYEWVRTLVAPGSAPPQVSTVKR